jgi:hypothetical protein
MSEWDKANIEEILRNPVNDWFTARLIRLIAKADRVNREKLRLGFPEEVAAWETYAFGKDGTE